MKTYELVSIIESYAPLALQEKWDNSGLLIDNDNAEITGLLLCVDITESTIEEAVAKKCNVILSHHPLIFSGLRKISNENYIERSVRKAIQQGIAIYAAHTTMDVISNGVSAVMCRKIGANPISILASNENMLTKLVTFVPTQHAETVRKALFEAGVGRVGNYSECSFNVQGQGTFKANDEAHPFVGEKNTLNNEEEVRIEMLLPTYLVAQAEKTLRAVHPYEEPAYDFISLLNSGSNIGLGMLAQLPSPMSEEAFIHLLKDVFGSKMVRTSTLTGKMVRTVAVCGGSGSSLINDAIKQKADVYVTADCKYHDFFIPENQLLLIDIGHFESEHFIKELFYDLISKKIPTFAIHFSENERNPVLYF